MLVGHVGRVSSEVWVCHAQSFINSCHTCSYYPLRASSRPFTAHNLAVCHWPHHLPVHVCTPYPHPSLCLCLQLGLLTSAEAESVVALEFNPVRIGFHGGAGEGGRGGVGPRQHCHPTHAITGCRAQGPWCVSTCEVHRQQYMQAWDRLKACVISLT